MEIDNLETEQNRNNNQDRYKTYDNNYNEHDDNSNDQYDPNQEDYYEQAEVNNTGFFYEAASECLPLIELNIDEQKYVALIDTDATLSLVSNQINGYRKMKLNKPIPYSTMNGRDIIEYEIHTTALRLEYAEN